MPDMTISKEQLIESVSKESDEALGFMHMMSTRLDNNMFCPGITAQEFAIVVETEIFRRWVKLHIPPFAILSS